MAFPHVSLGSLYLGSRRQSCFAMTDCMAKWHTQSRWAPVLSLRHSSTVCRGNEIARPRPR